MSDDSSFISLSWSHSEAPACSPYIVASVYVQYTQGRHIFCLSPCKRVIMIIASVKVGGSKMSSCRLLRTVFFSTSMNSCRHVFCPMSQRLPPTQVVVLQSMCFLIRNDFEKSIYQSSPSSRRCLLGIRPSPCFSPSNFTMTPT